MVTDKELDIIKDAVIRILQHPGHRVEIVTTREGIRIADLTHTTVYRTEK